MPNCSALTVQIFLCGQMLFLLVLYLGIEFLGHRLALFNLLGELPHFFRNGVPFCVMNTSMWGAHVCMRTGE